MGSNDHLFAKPRFKLIEECVIDRRMTKYAMQDCGMRFQTCKMIPRVWDMQLGYENLQMQELVMPKWILNHVNIYRVYHTHVWNW